VKHIRIEYHKVREHAENGDMSISRVKSFDNIADILSKALGHVDFLRLRHCLGVLLP
jgi:hypothetical protein